MWHEENAYNSIIVTFSGIVIEAKLEQFWKAFALISVISPRNSIAFRLEQKQKTEFSIILTFGGIVIEIKHKHVSNADTYWSNITKNYNWG